VESLLTLMERVDIAWESGDYETLRALLHPDGSWVLLSSNEPRTITSRDELVEALKVVRETTNYRIYTMKHEVLSENVVLASGYVRTPARNGQGHDLAQRYFLLEAKDGLFYRRAQFLTEDEARMAFAEGWDAETVDRIPAHPV
jgi:ketosteroid isomerase-like protein